MGRSARAGFVFMDKVEREEKELKNHKEGFRHKPAKRLGTSKNPKTLNKQKKRKARRGGVSRKQQRRSLIVLMLLFFFTCFVAVFLLHEHYELYPGMFERDSVRLSDRGTDYIDLTWNPVRNVQDYHVYYKEYIRDVERAKEEKRLKTNKVAEPDDTWEVRSVKENSIQFRDLKEGAQYAFILKADSPEREGKYTKPLIFSTKRRQNLKIDKKITKLTVSKPFKIEADAETELAFKSADKSVADIDSKTGEIVLKGAGVTEITVEAKETDLIGGDTEVVELEVIDSNPVKAGGADATNIYHLSPDNCELVKTVTGVSGYDVPQSFGYTGDKYIIAYGMSGQGRIISFPVDGEGDEGKEVSVPAIALGHPNGFTYADENKTCYCVKGWSSRAVTYEPDTGNYDALNLTYGCSGIAYDRKEKKLYTSSRTIMASYDIGDGYSVANTTGVVRHSSSLATQDIGGHGGIMLRCLSPNGNVHGTNYIDLYDMRNGMYYGSISCDLSEVESAIVNDDGFLEILANNTSGTDYIWRTNLNIETMAEGLGE